MPIEMTASSNAGSFVRTLQGRTGTGFEEGTHVHKDWWARTIDYDKALELAEDASRQREDFDVTLASGRVSYESDHDGFYIVIDGNRYKPTDHALQQMSIRLGIPSSSILRELQNNPQADYNDFDTMRAIVNNSVRRFDPDKEFKIRTYNDGTCRAWLSGRYAAVDNRWYIETLREFLPSGRLSHWRGDEDTIWGNVLLPDSMIDYSQSDDSDYGAMVHVGNCEIGTRTVTQQPSVFRSICMNGCIWGECSGQRIKRRHVGTIDLNELKTMIAENIEFQLNLMDNNIRQFLATRSKQIQLNDVPLVIAGIGEVERLQGRVTNQIWQSWQEHESHNVNLFGIVNAVTRAGQLFDNKTWHSLDMVGGSLVESANAFERMLSVGRGLKPAKLEKVFGVAV